MPEPPVSLRSPGSGSRRAVSLACLGLLGSALMLSLGLSLPACSSDAKDSTGGTRVLLHTRLSLEQSSFTSDTGWNVTLTRAFVAAGPFVYFDGVPPIAWHRSQRRWVRASRWFGIGTAHAHPGHYQAGNVMGEMVVSSDLDLLSGPIELPDGQGVTGTYRSARFSFSSVPSGELSSALEGDAALAEGRAEKIGQPPRFFRAFADLTEIEKSVAKGQVDGCVLEEANVASDGTITVLVNPKFWFDLVDFSELDVGTPEAPSEFPPNSQAKLAFAQGLAQLSAYEFAFDPISK